MRATTENLIERFYGEAPEDDPDLRVNFDRFVRRLEHDWRNGWPVTVLIDGSRTGVGKSTCGIHLCRRLDPSFALEQFAFRGRELEPLYARLPEWSMVQLDEPRDLMASKGIRDRELLHITAAIGSVRKNRIGTILISPKKELFDTLITNGLVAYWIFLRKRGVGEVHRAWTGATYRKSQRFYPYDRMRIGRIGFPSLDRDPFFRAYNELAVERNRQYYREEGEARAGRARRGAAAPGSAASPPSLTDTKRERLAPDLSPPPQAAPPPAPPPPVCHVCGRLFSRPDVLRRHARIHERAPTIAPVAAAPGVG